MYTDIREIRMERSMQWPNPTYRDDLSCFFTLGHFSWTYIKRINEVKNDSNPSYVEVNRLRSVHQKNDFDYSAYTQSTFILQQFSRQEQENIEDFWNSLDPFMMITRVHSIISTVPDSEGTSVQVKIENAIQAAMSQNDGPVCKWLCYRTLDLVDAVVICKANTIQTLLEAVGRLYTTKEIGDIYSYCCIRPEYIDLETDPEDALPSKLPKDKISLLSIRFAVRNSAACGEMLKSLDVAWEDIFGTRLHPNLITGNDDINIIARDISSGDLCRLYRQLFQRGSTLYTRLGMAISDMTTRLGVDAPKPIRPAPQDNVIPDSLLTKTYTDLQEKLANVDGVTQEELHILMEIIHSLVSISRNSVILQMCYILAGPIQGVINKLSDKCWRWDTNDVDEFLSGFAYLMEHVIRTEGSLVHHPETRPLLFDIPASILEFDLAFTDRCARYLTEREGNKMASRTYDFLLIPCLCSNITIHDWFNRPEDSERLLYVQIPLSMIYEPRQVVCNLVHEAAHHAGESTRLREQRSTCLRLCVAFLVAGEFDMEDCVPVVDSLYAKIVKLIPDEECRYLNRFARKISACLREILSTQTYIESLLYMYDQNQQPGDSFYWQGLQHYEDIFKNNAIQQLEVSARQTEFLFSECYADLAMVSLLGLEPKQYIELFNDDIFRLKEDHYENHKKARLTTFIVMVERIGLVLCAMRDNDQWTADELGGSELANYILSFVREYAKSAGRRYSAHFQCPAWLQVQEKDWCFHSFYVLDTIRVYLDDCLAEMLKDDKGKPEKALIQKRYRMFADDQSLSSDMFFQEINDYRNRIIPQTPV